MFGQFTPYLTVFIYLGILENIALISALLFRVYNICLREQQPDYELHYLYIPVYLNLLNVFPYCFFHSHTRHRLPAIGQTKDNMRDTNTLEKDITTPLHSIEVNNK